MNQAGGPGSRISNDVLKLDNSWVSFECFEDFDFPFHFTFLNGFKNFDNNLGIIISADSSINFGVFSLSYFVDDLVSLNVAIIDERYTHIQFHKFSRNSRTNPFAC